MLSIECKNMQIRENRKQTFQHFLFLSIEQILWKHIPDNIVMDYRAMFIKSTKDNFFSPGIGFVSKFPEDEDDDGRFLVHSVRPHRERGGRGVVKGDWLFTPPLYQKAFNCFLFTNKFLPQIF